MPYIKIRTNIAVSADLKQNLLSAISLKVAEELAKPERYVMAELSENADLIFSGNNEPAAYVELKSIGLSETQTQPLSSVICCFLRENFSIQPDRVYIEFTDIPRKYWGWNESTF
ncbi:MAG: phenylpyruvate tautomerase MIF-related protein [Methylococcales bacterium]